jgi:hypothetical protein
MRDCRERGVKRIDGERARAVKYIKQRSEIDCGIAALAMACDLDYERVADGLVTGPGCLTRLRDAMGDEGLNDDLVKDWLRLNGWAWQEVARNVWQRGGFTPRHPWPPQPFATTHICFVEATKGWHYCAMDYAGRVYDPWDERRASLSWQGYKRVSSVLGLFKISRKLSEAH